MCMQRLGFPFFTSPVHSMGFLFLLPSYEITFLPFGAYLGTFVQPKKAVRLDASVT